MSLHVLEASCMHAYESLRKSVWRNELNMRLKELRDYYATFMVHHGLIREEVDLLQGRVGKSVFMQHYFSPNIEDLRARVLTAVDRIRHNCTRAWGFGD